MTDHPADAFDPDWPVGRVAWRSWLSMKPWVMVWLWYLNVLFWVAFYFLPAPEAVWALVAYFAVGPFVLGMVVWQRGLTRLSGLIHLPWMPFVIWLGWRLYTNGVGLGPDDGPYELWLHLLLISTTVCLVVDAIDVVRWWAGERYVLGTPAAAAAGASRLPRTEEPGGEDMRQMRRNPDA